MKTCSLNFPCYDYKLLNNDLFLKHSCDKTFFLILIHHYEYLGFQLLSHLRMVCTKQVSSYCSLKTWVRVNLIQEAFLYFSSLIHPTLSIHLNTQIHPDTSLFQYKILYFSLSQRFSNSREHQNSWRPIKLKHRLLAPQPVHDLVGLNEGGPRNTHVQVFSRCWWSRSKDLTETAAVSSHWSHSTVMIFSCLSQSKKMY